MKSKNDKSHLNAKLVNDNFPHFSETLQTRFAQFADKPLFKTDVENLYDIFLANIPQHARQEYNCNCCRNFVNQFGKLVTISESGELTSVLWDENEVSTFFGKAVFAMKKTVQNARVKGIFLSSERVLGNPNTNGYDHMTVQLPASKVHNNRRFTAGQVMAEKREDFRVLVSGLLAFPLDVVDKAVNLLEAEALYRNDRFLGITKYFQELHKKHENVKDSRKRDNITWLAVATAPSGYTHIKSSVIGTLLEDIANGLSFDKVKRNFADKVNPANYQRAQTAPSENAKLQAEKIFAQLGYTPESLERRYAKFEEIPRFMWKAQDVQKKETTNSNGVFGKVATKEKKNTFSTSSVMDMPMQTMTYEKFARKVLPTAETVHILMDNPDRFMALVTAVHQHAPNMLQWDNTYSWYYPKGIDGEIERRVRAAGGQYDNNEIRASLIWEGYTDLDIHCITPDGKHIYYGRGHRNYNGGSLDVDANGLDGKTSTPVENIRWSNGMARNGRYRFYVHNYAERGGYGSSTPFEVELEVNGKVYKFKGQLRNEQKMDVFEFDYIRGQEPRFVGATRHNVSTSESWNVANNSFVKVKGITESPNMWGERKVPHAGQHVFFLLEGVKDTSEGVGRGFFTESLKPELREIRRVLEGFTKTATIEGADEATACGVGYSKDSEWNVIVKVTTGNTTQLIKIDRWD